MATKPKTKAYHRGCGYVRKDGRIFKNVTVPLPEEDFDRLKARGVKTGNSPTKEARNIIQKAVNPNRRMT